MAVAVELTWNFVLALVAALAQLALGVWVYCASPRSSVNRGFALFLVANGLGDAANSFFSWTGDVTRLEGAAATAGNAMFFVVVAGLALAALSYPGDHPMGRGSRWVFAFFVFLAMAGFLTQLAEDGTAMNRANQYIGAVGFGSAGAFAAWTARHLGKGEARRQESTRLVVLGLACWPLWAGPLFLLAAMTGTDISTGTYERGATGVLGVLALTAVWAAFALSRPTEGGKRRWGQISLLALSASAGIASYFVGWLGRPTYYATSVALVAIVAYGILRYNLFTIDRQLRFAISKSTIAAVFIAVFFIASEAAQQFFGDTLGSTYVGIGVAGTLVFAMAPLQRVAEKLAEKAVPVAQSAPPTDGPLPAGQSRREESYREAVRLAMRDRRISADERVSLFRLAEDLQIPAGHAAEIHADVERTVKRGGR